MVVLSRSFGWLTGGRGLHTCGKCTVFHRFWMFYQCLRSIHIIIDGFSSRRTHDARTTHARRRTTQRDAKRRTHDARTSHARRTHARRTHDARTTHARRKTTQRDARTTHNDAHMTHARRKTTQRDARTTQNDAARRKTTQRDAKQRTHDARTTHARLKTTQRDALTGSISTFTNNTMINNRLVDRFVRKLK